MSAQDHISTEDRKAESYRGGPPPRGPSTPELQHHDDAGFVRKCNEDLNITLIIAGLLSAVVAAFIIYIQPQLQEDNNDTSAKLLRVIAYNMDKTAFGSDVPQVPPPWKGPTGPTLAAQIILYISLALTTSSVLLALVVKQLLDLYETIGSLGGPEHGQGVHGLLRAFSRRLRRIFLLLSGLLQFALLLFFCALATYLWEISIPVAAILLVTAICSAVIVLFVSVFALANHSLKVTQEGD